jgi:hypothetical protein
MSAAVFPIGHYLGERHPESLHYVRVGLEHQTMTTDEFGVWVLAHQESPQWTVDKVVTLAARANLPDAAASAERLLSVGLLVNVSDQESFARSYRLDPLLVGLGNTEENPDTYAVGLPGHEPASLAAGPYELWQWSALAPTLWHTAEVRAKVSEVVRPPTALLPELLADVRPLLANSCGYLDLAQ